MAFFVYILASQRNGTLYIGYTDDLGRRMIEHKGGVLRGFTSKYGVARLVWFEMHESRESAWRRERQMKKWNRAWKIELIERFNPAWADLTGEIPN
jgi:putative endonuclease